MDRRVGPEHEGTLDRPGGPGRTGDETPLWSADLPVVDPGNGAIGAVQASHFSNQGGSAGLTAKAPPVNQGSPRKPLRVTLKPAPVWAFLEERDISQNELARMLGISSGYISQLMSGSAHPSPQVRQRLLRVLGVSGFDDLFTITD